MDFSNAFSDLHSSHIHRLTLTPQRGTMVSWTRRVRYLCLPPQPLAQALTWHKAYCARHMREARAVEVRTDAAIKRLTRERQRTRLGRVEDEAAERRHRVRAGAIRADELQVDRRVDDGDERVVPFDGHAAPARRVCALQAHTRRE